MNLLSFRIVALSFLSLLLFSTTATVADAQTPTLDSEQTAFLTLINNYRSQNGAGPLQVSVALQNSSQWMSTDMANKNYFSHTDSLGRDPFTRMAAFGYSHSPAGENIAAGISTAQNTFTQWQTACDPDATGACTYAHNQNMLNPSYKVIGIGRANNTASTYKWYQGYRAGVGPWKTSPLRSWLVRCSPEPVHSRTAAAKLATVPELN